MQHNSGRSDKKIMLYALSTCPWCNKTKRLLDELGVAYDFIDVDLLDEKEDAIVSAEIAKHTPDQSFQILVIDDKRVIQGFDEEEIRNELK